MADFVELECGLRAETWSTKSKAYTEVSLINLFDGSDADLATYAKLLTWLIEQGYTNSGMSRVEGYYGETEDVKLLCVKPKQ